MLPTAMTELQNFGSCSCDGLRPVVEMFLELKEMADTAYEGMYELFVVSITHIIPDRP